MPVLLDDYLREELRRDVRHRLARRRRRRARARLLEAPQRHARDHRQAPRARQRQRGHEHHRRRRRASSCIIVDDMIDTAGTLVNAAKALMKAGATRVVACATHAVLSGPAIQRIIESPLDEVVVTEHDPALARRRRRAGRSRWSASRASSARPSGASTTRTRSARSSSERPVTAATSARLDTPAVRASRDGASVEGRTTSSLSAIAPACFGSSRGVVAMLEITKLTATPRDDSGKGPSNRLRRDGQIPAVAYGKELARRCRRRLAEGPHRGSRSASTARTPSSSWPSRAASNLTRHGARLHATTRSRATLVHADFVQVKLDQPVDVDGPVPLHRQVEGRRRTAASSSRSTAPSRCAACPEQIPRRDRGRHHRARHRRLAQGERRSRSPRASTVRLPDGPDGRRRRRAREGRTEEEAAAAGRSGCCGAAAPAAAGAAPAGKAAAAPPPRRRGSAKAAAPAKDGKKKK